MADGGVAENPEATQKQIADAVGISRSRATQILSVNEKCNLPNSLTSETIEQEANDYIRCSQLRPKLLKVDHRGSTFEWDMNSVLELCKCETDKDAVVSCDQGCRR